MVDEPLPTPLPLVTVQLPMRDEYHVAERAITAACALDYPRDRLEIQVLDDSSDESRDLVRALVEDLHVRGEPIRLLQREVPVGYKAGALNEGLAQARGEFVAIFDADSAPPPDFLRRTLPAFRDPEVGLVQVRWEFSNAARTLLGRLQALILDGLFAVEQHVRAARRLPLQFNGTNGIWRRSSLEEVAPWRGDVLTEDAEISVRAQLRGWRLVHRRFGVAVSTVMHPENTRGLSAFVQQALEELQVPVFLDVARVEQTIALGDGLSASRIQLRREAEVTGADMLHELRLIRRSILSHPSVYDGWLHLAAISDHLGLCIEQLAGRRLPFSCADCLTGRVQFTIYPDGLIGPCTQIMPFADLRRYGFDIERFLWEFRPHRLMEQYGSRQCTEGCFVMQNALFSPRRLGKLLVGPYLERLGARAIMR